MDRRQKPPVISPGPSLSRKPPSPGETDIFLNVLATKPHTVHQKKPALLKGGLCDLLAVLVHVLRHLKMMLQRGQRLAGPILEFGIVAPFCVALEQRTASLCALTCIGSYSDAKSSGLVALQLVELLLRAIVEAVGIASFISPVTRPLSSALVLV